jgi:hypothetical protein
MVYVLWFRVQELVIRDLGLGFMVDGTWFIVYGQWFMVEDLQPRV